MKCPIGIVNEFSEWSNVCQECQYYVECMDKVYSLDKQDPYLSNNTNPLGDNFPTYNAIHFRTRLNKDRKDMVNDLFFKDMSKITQDDIIDIIIDLELYNKQCRKDKLKDRYKRKKEKQNE